MLMTYSYIILMMLIMSKKMKNYWSMSTSMLIILYMLFMSKYPMKDSMFALSDNLMLDSMSMLMLSLCLLIIPLMMLASYKLKVSNKMFMPTIMLLLMILMMCFSVNNLLLFYIMFEGSLIPTLMLIMLWGHQPERKMASLYIIMYTVTASLPLLIIILKMSATNFSYLMLMKTLIMSEMNPYLAWMMLMMAFMVKLPIFSMHLWLPKAHVEAPVAGSMVLAAILLKLGGYGLMRMNKLVDYNSSMSMMYYMMMSIASMGAIITNILCLRQTDLKSLIAYSSVGHMSLLIIGVMSNSKIGQYGSLIIMLTHGITSSYMFFLSNLLYEKINSRNIMLLNGAISISPYSSLMWMIAISMNMALPPSLNILGEIIIMMSSFFISKMMIIMLMMISFSSASYSLYLYTMINHGHQSKLTNMSSSIMSINFTIAITHIWPLLVTTFIPLKLTVWC
uniref:NADH-ubiquinone oxidoreductase chain 4 n=1 Tax=Olavius algarvensis TaxID=188229 RepID=A0A7R9RCR6_9ANNE|nr:ND4 CDS [Olavius algarvensis]